MITKMKFEKLFGRFDYEISLKPEGVTLITGPNGYGKSTILRCIEALSEGNIIFFSRLDFVKLEIILDTSEKKFIIIKKENELLFNDTKVQIDDLFEKISTALRRHPYIARMPNGKWMDRRTGEYYVSNSEYDLKRLLEDNVERHGFDNMEGVLPKKYETIIRQLKKTVGQIYFIKEQRLIKEKKNGRSEQEIINVIEELPNKFKNLINNISSNYSATANRLDSTYPNRLFNMESGINKEEYGQKMNEMTYKFEKLSKYDISEMQNSTNVVFKAEHAKALKIYFDDFNEKYKVYEDFIKKLDLFTDIVNYRLSFKKIKISRERGIIVTDLDSVDRTIELRQLSSGEKQVIVLFYELIFETINDVFLLIDEPEISLHIVWQKMFMDDLLKIVEYKGLKVIVATHSPQIINNHWDLQIDLGDLYGNQLNKS
ncbi:MAG: AAA family ATPase [Desulfitobacteriaceae bacterium]